jgi:hypothetical protein
MEKKMKTNIIKILWGILLIAVGGLFLVDRLGYMDLDLLTRLDWSIVFAVTSAFFFVCYLLAGVRQWGWLFPALIFTALALIVGVLVDNRSDAMIAMPILLSVGIPFYVGYLLDRKHWGLLIPAWIMTIVSAIVVLSESAYPDLIGAIVLYAIALPFIVVFLVSRRHKWALIIGFVLAFIGLFPLLGPILPDAIAGPVVMFLFFVFFVAIYLILKKSWWALIPAGIFLSIGVVALLDILLPNHSYIAIGGLEFGVYTGVLFLGFAITFGILWLLRGSQPTAWAKYPAIGLLIVSISAFLMWQTTSDLVPAVTLVVIGVAMILGSVFKRRGSHQLTSRQP